MKAVKRSSVFIAVVLVLGIVAVLGPTVLQSAQTPPAAGLSSVDCVKCHAGPPADIAANGAGHKKVTCQDCHTNHRPTVQNNIPKCNMCHMGKSHYELKNCLQCHKNPHTPLAISFAGNLTEPCLTCHTQQITQLMDFKSKHTLLNCTMCHSVHRMKPDCTQCHKPHGSDMVKEECRKCHKAHMPKAVTYAADIPSKNCGACHQKAYSLLASSKVKHQAFACAFCHQEKHKMVPNCQDCHGVPHPAGIMAKFPKCGECHSIAHDLNNWSMTSVQEPPKEIKKKK